MIFTHAAGNIDIEVYNGSLDLITVSWTASDDENVDIRLARIDEKTKKTVSFIMRVRKKDCLQREINCEWESVLKGEKDA